MNIKLTNYKFINLIILIFKKKKLKELLIYIILFHLK